MKRLLLIQDNQKFHAIASGFSKLLPALETVKELYEQLNLGAFSEAIFEDIREHGASNIVETYKAELNKQLDASGVKFPALRKQQFEGSLQPLHDFQRAVLALPDSVAHEHKVNYHTTHHTTYLLSYAAYDDSTNEFIAFTEETKESVLEEQCRTYTETEAEYKMWMSAQALLRAYKSMHEAVKDAGVQSHFTSSSKTLLMDKIIQNSDGEPSVNAGFIGDARSVILHEAAMKRRQEENERKYQKEREEREEAHKRAFDISTRKGQEAFESYHAQRELEADATRRNVQYLG